MMNIILKPIKLVIFAFAVFGALQIEYKGQKLMVYLTNWINSYKAEHSHHIEKAPQKARWARDEAIKKLEESKERLKKDLSGSLSEGISPRIDNIAPLAPEKAHNVQFIPNTRIPLNTQMSQREQIIIQKLNIENELHSRSDKEQLKDLLD